MFTLRKLFTFEASHYLPRHDGKCRRLHGHSWRAEVVMDGERLIGTGPQTGMLIDYGLLSSIVKPIVEADLDHRHLNDLLENPTSEELARWLYERVRAALPDWARTGLKSVVVHETCTSACEYSERP